MSGTVWKPIGPSPISGLSCCPAGITFQANGRVNSIAVDPNSPSVIYLGSAGGGVWKSVNGGTTWNPLIDQQASLGIGTPRAIAIDPTNPSTIYAGTGSFALLAQSLPRPLDFTQSRGVLKSTDGGASWIELGSGFPSGNDGNALSLFSRTHISTVIVDPADIETLYLAAGHSGTVDVPGGLFRSADGGRNWVQGQGMDTDGTAESLALDTSSPPGSRVLYAGVNGRGVLKSSDGGQSWTKVLGPSTPAVVAAGASGFGKVMLDLAPPASPPNPAGQVLYVTLVTSQIAEDGRSYRAGLIFENANGGAEANWVRKNAQILDPTAQVHLLVGDAFSDMALDPASPGDGTHDLIYWGGLTQYLSTDSGTTFSEIGEIHGTHGDSHTFRIVPRSGDTSVVYVGDDGGIWRSEDQGDHWTGTSLAGSLPTINAGGLQTGTFYGLSVKQDATASVTLGNTQDSGILRTAGIPLWTQVPDTGDGIDVVFDRIATNDAYALVNGFDGDRLYMSGDGGMSWSDITPSSLPALERDTFKNRLAVDPNHAGYLYVGGSRGSVFQSQDGGASFRSLGTPAPGKYISSLDVAPSNSNNLVIAANDVPLDASAVSNGVFVTTNAFDPTVTFPGLPALPSRFVTRVAFDPNDPTVIYATLAGFGATTPAQPGHVYRTNIGAATWTDISPPVDIPVNALALDGTSLPAVIYIGTDLGVLRSDDGGSTWTVVDDVHLPNAAVSDMDLNLQAGVLRAATWGRGVFELAAPSGPVISVAQSGLAFGETCAVTGGTLTIDVSNVGTQDLVINSVQRLSGSSDFTVLPNPPTPLTISPGGQVTFTVQFIPTTPGTPESAFIRISSNDPLAPFVDLLATGTMETTPPNISSVTPTPAVLLPANHKMREVSLQVSVSDNCDPAVAQSCRIVSVASNEPVSGTGDGDASPDWQITGNLTANLRAERSGSGTGRIYTLTVECTDSAGNSARRTTTVAVPHDLGFGNP